MLSITLDKWRHKRLANPAVNRTLKRIFVAAGGASWCRASNGSRLRILMYHRFPGDPQSMDRALSAQFTHIRRFYRPVSLREVVRCRQAGQPLPSRALAITVDDGYADFQRAWNALKAFKLPATLFVASGFVDREIWLWPDVVHFCASRSSVGTLRLQLPEGAVFERSLKTAKERQTADADLDAVLLGLPDDKRRECIARLPAAAGLSLPQEIPGDYAPLEWEALRKMSAEGLEVGAHTQTHPVLARISAPDRLQAEVEGSKSTIEKRLGVPAEHFCYPNGQASDFNRATIDAVRAAGFLSASTAQRGLNGADDSLWEFRRIGVDPFMAAETFALELAGFRMK